MTTFHIITAGCSQNSADSEQMAGLLKKARFEPVENLEDADIIILNTCTVKTPSEEDFFAKLDEIKREHPYKIVIIAGCIAQADPEKLKKFSLIGTRQIHKVVEVVEEALNDNVIKLLEMKEIPTLNLPRIRKNSVVEIIPISRGCLGACTFCKTKSARGDLASYPIEEILTRARQAVSEGAKEIWLTSQDTGCYGLDINTNLAKLLNEMVKIPGQFMIRAGMMNPNHLTKMQDELIEAFKHEKLFKFLHLPVQSGNDEIIKSMNRIYTVAEFKKQIESFRTAIPNINIMTDIIAGFPGETDEQHWDTLNLIREISPDSINISKFWARPKTKAAEMKQLPGEVIKHRSKIITDIFHNISKLQNEKWLNWEGMIVIDEKGSGKDKRGSEKGEEGKEKGMNGSESGGKSNETGNKKSGSQWIGRNDYYKQVIVEGNYKLGDIIKVKIVKAEKFHLKGESLA